jgi:hypothetical protein
VSECPQVPDAALRHLGVSKRGLSGLSQRLSFPQSLLAQLKSLQILWIGGHIHAEDVITLLRHTPRLSTFQITIDKPSDDHRRIFNAFSKAYSDHEMLVPCLQVVRVTHIVPGRLLGFGCGAFIGFVKSRSRKNAMPLGALPLKEVELRGLRESFNEIMDERAWADQKESTVARILHMAEQGDDL